MRKLLVTGGAGFVGTNFVYYWLDKYPQDKVIVLDALTYAGNKENLNKAAMHQNFQFVHGNILDQELVENLLSEYKIDTIVHFAAESHVDRSISTPDDFIDTNITGTHTLLKSARNKWLNNNVLQHRFHHISTDEVYGSLKPESPPFKETNAYLPNSPYAASKAASDHLVRAYNKTYGLNTTISNCSNNYGPFQFPEKLIPLIIVNILNGKSLPVYGDGRQIRDWLYVDDHNRGVDLIINKGKQGETYNIGGNSEWENIDIVKLVCSLIDQRFEENQELIKKFPDMPFTKQEKSKKLITLVQDRAGHDRRYAINADKIKKKLMYSPEVSFEIGIRKTIHWYLENEKWWKKLIAINKNPGIR